jgi:hypothetical protein
VYEREVDLTVDIICDLRKLFKKSTKVHILKGKALE